MILILFVILALSLYGFQIKKENFHDDFLSRNQTDSIKGIFILFVFVSHAFQYVQRCGYDFSSLIDMPMKSLTSQLGQLMVVMFLFYSGYGVLEAVKNRGCDYLKGFPQKRIFPTVINFDIAVLVFLVVGFLFAKEYGWLRIVQALVGWESVGNSNWYIFDIVVCYILFWAAMCLTKRKGQIRTKKALAALGIMLLAFVVGMSFVKETRWYNTVFAFWGGMFFSIYKDGIVQLLKKRYVPLFVGLSAFVLVLKLIHYDCFCLRYNMLSLSFALWVLMITMKVKMQNNALIWLGQHLFPLYIYQRLPMNILYDLDNGAFVRAHPLIYILLCFVITVVVSYFYKYWQIKATTRKTP